MKLVEIIIILFNNNLFSIGKCDLKLIMINKCLFLIDFNAVTMLNIGNLELLIYNVFLDFIETCMDAVRIIARESKEVKKARDESGFGSE
jgi:hypothetical protein